MNDFLFSVSKHLSITFFSSSYDCLLTGYLAGCKLDTYKKRMIKQCMFAYIVPSKLNESISGEDIDTIIDN